MIPTGAPSFLKALLTTTAALLLASCGSGGGPAPIPNPAPVPSAAQPEFLYAAGAEQILSYTVSPSTGALSDATATPGPSTGFGDLATLAVDPAAKFLF